ncbi:sigma-70 family RNA polymerase sigma factor [Lactobacillus sp. W8089]|nr:sigma-70 family RNA polymerase sigma factor [Lactobacillus sp. W8086]MBI0108324.1 sigma-70 family RNA polymerase sigma factor [Lactobacillus sp. W8085]MBI0111542.1 sigma-70 family RNA polymerase sigma factor [Lactobacillus sp. W8088]MBI0115257.1 sigma-70 family RNA polymerase sigma factor [Lactobacillus sp. W8087]MBI0118982.1 sigma-70 family RNA polymerase sigma factor [Lactobacillus sp. W8089]MBI0130947.1 sigma-70 family RNA polymerase sigma factor [Lactobacillus sp. W8090]
MVVQHDLATGFQLAITNVAVIYGAVKRAGVYRSNNLYADLIQEAYLTYAQVWSHSCLSVAEFQPYIFQRIVWRTQDLLRRERYRQNHVDFTDLVLTASQVAEPLFWQTEVQRVVGQLTVLEQKVFWQHLIGGQNLKTLADTLHVSSRYLRKIRAQVRQKLRPLLQK